MREGGPQAWLVPQAQQVCSQTPEEDSCQISLLTTLAFYLLFPSPPGFLFEVLIQTPQRGMAFWGSARTPSAGVHLSGNFLQMSLAPGGEKR